MTTLNTSGVAFKASWAFVGSTSCEERMGGHQELLLNTGRSVRLLEHILLDLSLEVTGRTHGICSQMVLCHCSARKQLSKRSKILISLAAEERTGIPLHKTEGKTANPEQTASLSACVGLKILIDWPQMMMQGGKKL